MRRNWRSYGIYKWIGRSGRDPRFQGRDPAEVATGKKAPTGTIEKNEEKIDSGSPVVVYIAIAVLALLALKVTFGR